MDTIDMAWSAAAQGLGLAIGRLPLLAPELSCGRLVPVLGPPVRGQTGYWLTTAPATLERAEVVAFRDWLIGELGGLLGAAAQTPA